MTRKGHISKFMAWLITAVMLTAMLPAFTVSAAENAGEFSIAATDGVTALAAGTDYSFSSNKLTISTQTPVSISMADGVTVTSHVIAVDTSKGDANISFRNINIETANDAITLSGGNNAVLNFSGTNTITSTASYRSGIVSNATGIKIKSEDEGSLKILKANSAIYSDSTITGKPLDIEGNINLDMREGKSAIFYQAGPVNFSGTPVVSADISNYAIYGAGLTFSGGKFSIKNTSGYAINSIEGTDIEIGGTTDIHIKEAKRGIYTGGGNVTVKDSAKIRMYDGEGESRSAGITMDNVITTTLSRNPTGGLTVEGNAVIDAFTNGAGISVGKTKIAGNAKVYITVENEGSYSKDIVRIDGDCDILGNAEVDLKAKSGKANGIYGSSSVNVNLSESAKVKIDGTTRGVYVGSVNLSGSASMVIKDAAEQAFYNGTVTIADMATFEASLAEASAAGKYPVILMKKYTVKPAAGKAYMVKAGESAAAAEINYYAAEKTEKATNAWKYFYAEPADVYPVTITANNKEMTYDGNAYDVSALFNIDANAGEATYSIVDETGTDVGAGTLSGKMLTITKAGKITIKINTAAKGQYLAGEQTAVFTVKKATPPRVYFTAPSDIVYGDSLERAVFQNPSNGTYECVDKTIVPDGIGNKSYMVRFVPNDADLYDYTGVQLESSSTVAVKPRPVVISWERPTSLIYDGTDKTVTPSVSNKVGDDVINLTVEGTRTAKNQGTYTARVTGVDNENYTVDGGENLTEIFIIERKELTADNVSAIADVTYTGEQLKPTVEVKDGETVLVLDTDYTVAYENNTNAGPARAIISFIGNYQGSANKEFTIRPKTIGTNIALQAPVKNAVPQTSVETEEYSATVDWSPAAGDKFGYSTVYIATVRISPKTNYTVDGILENGYVFVSSTSVVNAANSGEVTVTYPATGRRGGGGISQLTCTVTFDTNGGSKAASQSVSKESAIKEPTAPTKEGFDFAGWYTDKELKTKYDFSKKVTGNFTLYAAWTEKDNSKSQIILTIGEKAAQVFGTTKTNDVAPIIVNDRTMLPARFVAENLGAEVSWNEEKELVTIKGKNLKTGKDTVILITIGADSAVVNGSEVKLDSPAFIENDRTYTPIRFISEYLGASVEWVEAEQKVIIIK